MAKKPVNPKVGVWLDRVHFAGAVTWNYIKQLPDVVNIGKNEETGEWEVEFRKPQLRLPEPPVPEEKQKLHRILREIDDPETAERIAEAYKGELEKKAAEAEKQRLEEEAREAEMLAQTQAKEAHLEELTNQLRAKEAAVAEVEETERAARRKREEAEGAYHHVVMNIQETEKAIEKKESRAKSLLANAHDCNDAIAKAQNELELAKPKLATLQLQMKEPVIAEGQEELVVPEVDGSDILLNVKPSSKAKKIRKILLANADSQLDVIRSSKDKPKTSHKATAYLVDKDLQHPSYGNGSGYLVEDVDGQTVISTHGLLAVAARIVTLKEDGKRTHTLQIHYEPAKGATTSGAMVLRINL